MTTATKPKPEINYAKLRDQALELHDGGMSAPEIARMLDLPRATIYAWLPKSPDDAKIARMLAMREQGMTNSEIGQHFQISRQRVAAAIGPTTRRGRPVDERTAVRVRLTPANVERVVAIAANLGIRVESGAQAGRGSINALLDEIATGNLKVAWKPGRNGYTSLIKT